MKKILVVGDVMVDHYTYVYSERMSAEAPVPVYDVKYHEYRLGGAANVAQNLKVISNKRKKGETPAEVIVAGVFGEKSNGIAVSQFKKTMGTACPEGDMIKHRYVDLTTGKIVARFDNIKSFPIQHAKDCSDVIRAFLKKHRHELDAVVISDYDKGTITDDLAREICQNSPCRVFVDSKRYDLSPFRSAYAIKLNMDEYDKQVSNKLYRNHEELFQHVVVTLGAKGACLRINENLSASKYVVHSEMFPVKPAEAIDVTGCGDTFTAAMVFYMTCVDADIRGAIRFANECARKVVSKLGTSTI